MLNKTKTYQNLGPKYRLALVFKTYFKFKTQLPVCAFYFERSTKSVFSFLYQYPPGTYLCSHKILKCCFLFLKIYQKSYPLALFWKSKLSTPTIADLDLLIVGFTLSTCGRDLVGGGKESKQFCWKSKLQSAEWENQKEMLIDTAVRWMTFHADYG